MKKINTKIFLKVCFTLIATSAIFIGCGSSGDGSTGLDVTVVDGYIKEASVKDASGVSAIEIDGAKGLYRFNSSPSYPITVSGGRLAQTGLKFDVNLSTTSGTVISPITTIISDDDNIIGSLGATMGGLSEEELRSDFIKSDNTDLQKLAQLFYAVLLSSKATNNIKTRMASSSDTNLTSFFEKAIEDSSTSPNKNDILLLLNQAKDFNGSGSIEEFMKTTKSSIKVKSLIPNPILASFETNGSAYDVGMSNDELKAYVADGYEGLKIIDISEPSSPKLLASLDTDGFAQKVSLSNDGLKAYVADGYEGLKIIDISEPNSPRLLASLDTNGSVKDVSLSNDGLKAYVADGNEGLKIIDISDPNSPRLLASLDTNGTAEDVSVSSDGRIAYLSDGYEGLKIIDISGPSAPKLLASFGKDELITGVSGGGVSTSYPFASGVSLSNDGLKAYLAYGKSGLKIIDINDPSSPKLLAGFDSDVFISGIGFPDSSSIDSVSLSGDGKKAYVTAGYGLKVIDISNPGLPSLLASFDTDGKANSVSLSDNGLKAYVVAEATGLQIIDLSRDRQEVSNNANDIVLANDGLKAYVADGNEGLKVIDISEPSSPKLLASLDTDGYAQGVSLSNDGTKVYMADFDAGLKVIDISEPSSPSLIASLDTDGNTQSVSLSNDGTKAYLADGYAGLKIIDISEPSSPSLLASFKTRGDVRSVSLSNDGLKAYVGGNSNLEVISIDF